MTLFSSIDPVRYEGPETANEFAPATSRHGRRIRS